MITHLKELPESMVGFRAEGEITKEDFDNVVMPAVKKAVDRNKELNYMLELDTSIKNFTIGAWVKDAALGIINLSKWHRVAIRSSVRLVTDCQRLERPGTSTGNISAWLIIAVTTKLAVWHLLLVGAIPTESSRRLGTATLLTFRRM